jgi:hypothetical protein
MRHHLFLAVLAIYQARRADGIVGAAAIASTFANFSLR